jgi:ATP-binding cassette subfamily B protein
VVAELGLALGLAVAYALHGYTRLATTSRVGIALRARLLDRVMETPPIAFESPATYDALLRARQAAGRPVGAVQGVADLGQGIVTLVGSVGLLATAGPWIAIALVVSVVPSAVLDARLARSEHAAFSARAPRQRRLGWFEHVLSSWENLKEVRLLGLSGPLRGRLDALSERFRDEDLGMSRRRMLVNVLGSSLAALAFYGAYAAVVVEAAAGGVTVGALTMYVAAFRQGQSALQRVLSAGNGLNEGALYLGDLFAFFDARTELPGASAPPLAIPLAPPMAERGLRFVDVGFRYPGREEWAVRHVDLYVPEGESLAIVGHNGAGKSTLVKLLTGLLPPVEGAVLLDGRDLRAWEPDALRRRMTVMFQDFLRWHLPVRDNVGFGDVARADDDAGIARALERAGAAELVARLPAGLDTPLGREFDDGIELSGGQWQRLALARAFMREGADLLVLDEPTSALDAAAEIELFARIRELWVGRTSIVISHRFPTVRHADSIVVIDRGAVVEQGTHEQLVAGGGLYARLFALQAEGYR